jgi:hypothetical protein
MSYDYQIERKNVFTEEGVKTTIAILEKATAICKDAGCVSMSKLFQPGSTWVSMACADFLCEIGVLRQITDPTKVTGQDQVFVKMRREA